MFWYLSFFNYENLKYNLLRAKYVASEYLKIKKEIIKMTVLIDKDGVKVIKIKTNCENNIELLWLEKWNLLDGYMAKELNLLRTLLDGLKQS